LVCGFPGAGKSTVAEGIADKLGMPIFSVDPIESSMIKSGIRRSFETGLAAYLVAEALAAEQLRLGMSVIIDAVSAIQEARDLWRNVANRFEARLVVIECVLERDLHKTRIEARIRNMPGFPEVTWDDVESRRKEYLPWENQRLVLDTSGQIEIVLERALEHINNLESEDDHEKAYRF